MTLQTKLDSFKSGFEKQVPQSALDVMHKSTDDLRASGILDATVKVGDQLDDFTLSNQDGAPVPLSTLVESGPVILSFFRGTWCPFCNLELEALNDALADFSAAGVRFVAVSPQTSEHSAKLKADKGLDFDILSDVGNGLAETLGVAFAVDAELRKIYESFGVKLPDYNGDDSWRLPMPTRLVIDQDRIVRHAEIDPDYTVRPEPSETLSVVQGLKEAA